MRRMSPSTRAIEHQAATHRMWAPIEGRVVRPSRSPAASLPRLRPLASRRVGCCGTEAVMPDTRQSRPSEQEDRPPTQAAAGLAATAPPHRLHHTTQRSRIARCCSSMNSSALLLRLLHRMAPRYQSSRPAAQEAAARVDTAGRDLRSTCASDFPRFGAAEAVWARRKSARALAQPRGAVRAPPACRRR